MSLTEQEKQKIAEEEAYRARLAEQEGYRASLNPTRKPKGGNGCLTIILILLGVSVLSALVVALINPTKKLEEVKQEQANQAVSLPVMGLAGMTEQQVRSTYALIITDYQGGFLTSSKKIKITGFDLPEANVQIDYKVSDNTVYYVGYSFSAKPVYENVAWKVVGINKPRSTPETNPGIMNRKVVYWQNIPEIQPYKMLQVIYESGGKVSKIALSMEDLATSQSSRSLYYVPLP